MARKASTVPLVTLLLVSVQPSCGGVPNQTNHAQLQVEVYFTYGSLFIPEQHRGLTTLIRIPAGDTSIHEIGSEVSLCFEVSSGRLVYQNVAANGCDGLVQIKGSTVFNEPGYELIDVEILPYKVQRKLREEWSGEDEEETKIVTLSLGWGKDKNAKFVRIMRIDTIDRKPVSVK